MRFPDYIIEEMAARRTVFFLGAGASAASKSADGSSSPPSWEGLLKRIRGLAASRSVKRVAKDLMDRDDLLGAAEVLVDAIPGPDFHECMIDEIQRPDYQSNELVDAVHGLDPKIVVSTNYDLVYENLCSEEIRTGLMQTKSYRDTNLIDVIRSGTRLYVYAHGCIKAASDIVLTSSQYYKARRDNPGFFSVLESIFMTNTVIFLGYSLRDPDIQLILESNSLKVRSTRRHILVLEAGNPKAVAKSMEARYDVQIVEYPKGRHDEVHRYLSGLIPEVESKRTSGI